MALPENELRPERFWLEVSLETDGEVAEAVAEALQPFAHGGSVVFEQKGAAHDPDPSALEPEVTVKIYVPGEADTLELRRRIEEVCYHLNRILPTPPPTFRRLKDEDWATVWKKDYRPFKVGDRLWIQPSWLETENYSENDIVITLDPGMAFGTGLHPSTQLCLQALAEKTRPGMCMLDVGSGSGILSVAAAKFGANNVVALDTDYMAARATFDNAVLNGVGDVVKAFQGTLPSVGQTSWDLVVVNILAPVIVSMIQTNALLSYVKKGGKLILSGIIADQAGDVLAALGRFGGKQVHRQVFGDWIAIVAEN